MRTRTRSILFRAILLGLVPLAAVTCTADSPWPTGTAEQAVINPPLPPLNLILNAKTTVTIGPSARVEGDVASGGVKGSVLFDVNSSQGFFNVLANTVTVSFGASVGHVFGNDITINGSASQKSLGLDPAALPQVPAVTPATPGTKNVSTNENQSKQLCPGRYGVMSLGINSTLNLNGGVYEVTRLNLADSARLEPSEPVVILVSGGVTTGMGAFIGPSNQAIKPMTAANIRIEVGGAVTLGNFTQVRAHLLAAGKITTGTSVVLTGAAWAKAINIGPLSFVQGEGRFVAQTPSVPPPCDDNDPCTTDRCDSTPTAVCTHTPAPRGTSCEDGNICNGAETCDAAGRCLPGTNVGAGTACPDGDVCNGDETCNGFGVCLAGTPPEVADGNSCTADACDPVTGVSHTVLPDGTPCSGVGVCQAGVCSVGAAVFSDDFVELEPAVAQCDHWNDFRASQLANGPYESITMSGSRDPTGVTCGDRDAATPLCQALHNSIGFFAVFCNGHSWQVGQCIGSGTVLSLDVDPCSCKPVNGYAIRPCVANGDWGGINTDTCSAPTQTMTVVCL